jgi:protease-4
MTRVVNAAQAVLPAALVAALLAAAPAAAQVRNALERQAGVPAGLALPVPGVAVAEEPAAIGATPAAAGFVSAPAFQWFKEADVTQSSRADGLYGAAGLGPLGLGYSIEWVRPGEPAFSRYRKNTFALAVGDKRSWSGGVAWNRFSSPETAVEALGSWDAGVTVRPFRHLSVAAAMLGRDARLGDTRLPLHYDIGVATRFLGDAFTLSADLLADDRARDDFHATHLAFGGGIELRAGYAAAVQVLVPIRDVPGVSRDPSTVFTLTWNQPHAGLSAGGTSTPDRSGWLFGLRSSAERYRAAPAIRRAPTVDVARELEPDRIPFLNLGEKDPYGLLLLRLDAMAEDGEVSAVAVKIGDLRLGAGRIEELRAALARLRERKPVLAYLTGGGTREYWLATAATAIAMPPGSILEVNGISTSNLYLKEALARLGVAFEVVTAGAYKSAPEPLVRTGPSPETREATNALLDDVFGRLVNDVAAARRLPPERVRELVDQGLLGSAEAKEAGLVDEVLWPDQAEELVRRLARSRLRVAGRYRPEPTRIAQRWGTPPIIEIVRIQGAIVGGRSRRGLAELVGAETVAAQLRRAAADRNVKAIVIRIESPGGDGLASDLIWREVVRARERKPVVASMGDVAASGGYLAAVGANAIVAEPSTLTGSIGVFVVKPDLSGLLAKLGVGREAWARGETAQLASTTKPWTEKERRAVEREIESFYRQFVDRVAEGRRLPRAQAEAAAGGRVWTGRQAVERGLVDALGSLRDAVALAAERARLSPGEADVRRAEGKEGPGLLGGTLLRASSPLAEGAAPDPLARLIARIPELHALEALSEMGPILALPVEWVESPP